jgi:hypothetical protein
VPGSGRKPGTPNRTTAELREQITAARPVEFLTKVAEGRKIRVGPQGDPGAPAYAYPSLEQRLRAAELLMKKILPDLTAAEVTGPVAVRSKPSSPLPSSRTCRTRICLPCARSCCEPPGPRGRTRGATMAEVASARPDPACACFWHGKAFQPRGAVGKRFCSDRCRAAFHRGCRLWAMQAAPEGRLSMEAVRSASKEP